MIVKHLNKLSMPMCNYGSPTVWLAALPLPPDCWD